jgi:hypothetical protein
MEANGDARVHKRAADEESPDNESTLLLGQDSKTREATKALSRSKRLTQQLTVLATTATCVAMLLLVILIVKKEW